MDVLFGLLVVVGVPILIIWLIVKTRKDNKRILTKAKKATKGNIEEQEDSVYAKDFSKAEFLEMKSTKFPSKYLKPIKDLPDNGNFFYGKKVVITGGLENFPFREALAKKLWELGADLDRSIGKYTEVAIVGSYNVGPKKMEQILSQNIKIIREPELLKLLNE